jgi:UDP-N-acetylglucosamine 2-epimerase (non-hydrolysing)/GDP/UDP-N,N'-diacetylbacillosamine 2-epimerase (hydrolysing)
MRRKIAVVTGTRADYGILKPVLKKIEAHPDMDLSLIVTGMHLSKEFGYTIREIKKDGFKIDATIRMLSSDDTGAGMAKSLGKCLLGAVKVLKRIKPEIVLLLGDRAEMLAFAIAAAYTNRVIAHISGGDISGHIDNSVRHAIVKLAHIHFESTKRSAERVIKMGEDPSTVFTVRSPSVDSILHEKLLTREEICKKYGLDPSRPILLVIQHPVLTEADSASSHIRETLEATVELNHQTVVIYPNSDAGGRRMIKVIKEFEKYPFIKTLKSIPHIDYLSLMKASAVMIGNSSSGITEAPSFGLPVVNIGTRQIGRERAGNVINADYKKKEIITAVNKALYDKSFIKKIKKVKNPYGDGKAAQRIVEILNKIPITPQLLQKKFTY